MTFQESQENNFIKEWFKDIMPIANILNSLHDSWQTNSIKPEEVFGIIKTQQKKMFLALAEKMVETYGFKATLMLITDNFLDEEESGRTDGLIDLPIK